MKKFTKAISVLVAASVMASLCSCDLTKDKSMDEVLDLAEDVCKYTSDLDYKKLSKMTEDGDDKLEEIFEGVEDDGFREIIASTLEYEIDEDSLEKDGKNGYTVDVTFTYVDYEKVLDVEEIVTVDMFEDMVKDSDDINEETITLEFEKDGSDILFVNIDDLEDLFPYWDEELSPAVNGGASGDLNVSPADPSDITEATEDTEPSDTTPSLTEYDLGGVWDNDNYPDPAPYLIDGEQYLLPNTNILFTVPEDAPISGLDYNGVDDCFFMLGGYWGTTYEDYYSIVDGTDESCYSESARELHFGNIDLFSESEPGYVSHEISYMEVTYYGVTYEGILSTITRSNGEIIYHFCVLIGNDDFYYTINIRTRNMDDITSFGENFTLVEV